MADLRGYPTVRRLAERLAADTATEEFSSSLENLLTRLSQLRDGMTVAEQVGENPHASP